MKKYLLTFIAAILVSFSAMAFNNTLKEAYEILQTAKTADDYSRAEKNSAPQAAMSATTLRLTTASSKSASRNASADVPQRPSD